MSDCWLTTVANESGDPGRMAQAATAKRVAKTMANFILICLCYFWINPQELKCDWYLNHLCHDVFIVNSGNVALSSTKNQFNCVPVHENWISMNTQHMHHCCICACAKVKRHLHLTKINDKSNQPTDQLIDWRDETCNQINLKVKTFSFSRI